MENQTKPSEWVRNHIIVCGVPEYKEPILNAIADHLDQDQDQKKEA